MRQPRHTALTLEWTRTWVRITIADQGGPTVPCRRALDLESMAGRGIALIDELSAQWGYVRTPAGTKVWCDLAEDPAKTPARPIWPANDLAA
jgi:hypothetical protein